MHPASSVIFFTTASGAGFGIMSWLCVAILMGHYTLTPHTIVMGVIGLVLAGAGLLSSTLHLLGRISQQLIYLFGPVVE